MYRVVFCPSEEKMAEAERLAEEQHLPILVGRNERLKHAEMDDTCVSIVNVPTDEHAEYEQELKEPGSLFSIHYTNDFRRIDSARLLISSPSGKVSEGRAEVRERHFARFMHRPGEHGDHEFRIADNEEIFFVGGFRVGDGGKR